MSLTAELILPEDVLLVPVIELAPELREELGEEEGFALTRPRGRATSSLVGPDVAELLAEFRSPSTVVDAVVRYSRKHEFDPRTILDQAYPALRQCLGEGFLVPPAAAAAGEIVASIEPGTVLGDPPGEQVVIGECVRVLDDTEVYRASVPSGEWAAVKIARESGDAVPTGVRDALCREADVLAVLGGAPAPRLWHDGSSAERPFLVMEWCDGLPASGLGRADRTDVLLAVLDAYVALAGAGVSHGDIHPGNVLVDSAGRVRLVDFGLATAPGVTGEPRRGGVQHYFEPEFAAAILAGRRPPQLGPAADVFGLAALGYELIAGRPWVDLALDTDEALRRIIDREPVPFRELRLPGHRALEAVLRAGLATAPADRPASVRALADRIRRAVRVDAEHATAVQGAAGRKDRDAVVDRILAGVRPGGHLHRAGTPAPVASMSHGAAGVALAVLRIATCRADPDLLQLADAWAERAHRLVDRPDAFTAPELNEVTIGPATPYHHRSGPALVRALVGHAAGNAAAMTAAIDDYRTAVDGHSIVCDLTLGSGGALLGAALLLEATRNDGYADTAGLRQSGATVAEGLWEAMGRAGDPATSGSIAALGVAHGWAGLLLALLRWSDAVGDRPPDGLVDRLDQLAALGEPVGAGLRWPWTNRTGAAPSVSVPGWCNGTAGHLMLWTQAYRSLSEPRYLELAERAAHHLGATFGGAPQLCCGTVGQAYALLDLYRLTGEQNALTGAHRIAELARTDLADLPGADGDGPDGDRADSDGADGWAGRSGDHDLLPGSLHRGALGAAALLADLAQPEFAAMPGFGLEGW